MKKQTAIFEMEFLFQALGDRTRLRLINLLADGEVCVCFLVEALGISQPKISRHLAYLRRAGLVATRREGKWMHYRLCLPSDPMVAEVLNAVRGCLGKEQDMQGDRSRLVRLCCSPKRPAILKKAPKPARATGTRPLA